MTLVMVENIALAKYHQHFFHLLEITYQFSNPITFSYLLSSFHSTEPYLVILDIIITLIWEAV
jgi:hypothetical protein